MKQALIIALPFLFLMACGQEQAAEPVAETPAVVEEQVVEEAIDATEEAADAADDVIEVVAESAAEPDADEQAILLAQADVPVPPTEWQFKEGQHYIRLVPTQPTVGGADKIEVTEFFYYLCPHCYNFEPLVNDWLETKPANVRFVQVPAMWNQLLVMHGRMYYTSEILARNGVIEDHALFQATVYQEMHVRRNQLGTETAIRRLFERFGVSDEQFDRTWNSFEVDQKMRVANDLARRYSVASTPTMVVNGKYRFGAQEAGSYPKVIEVIDELIIRESLR